MVTQPCYDFFKLYCTILDEKSNGENGPQVPILADLPWQNESSPTIKHHFGLLAQQKKDEFQVEEGNKYA